LNNKNRVKDTSTHIENNKDIENSTIITQNLPKSQRLRDKIKINTSRDVSEDKNKSNLKNVVDPPSTNTSNVPKTRNTLNSSSRPIPNESKDITNNIKAVNTKKNKVIKENSE
jgi:hypothetical protein